MTNTKPFIQVTRSKIPFEEILGTSISACVDAWNKGDAFAFKRAVEMLEILSSRSIYADKSKLKAAISKYRREKLEAELETIHEKVAGGE